MILIDLVSELLYKHNCVIIPDFGGFVANFKPAEFEPSRLILSPARKKVAFNQSLRENDGLLMNSLVQKKSISYEQAEKEVNLFSRFLNDRLKHYKNYEFKNIGSFYLNKESTLVFVAYEGLNFYKKSYGLQDAKVKRLISKPVALKLETAEKVEKVKITPGRRVKKRQWIHLPQIAASVILLAAFGLVLWQLMGSPKQNIAASQNDATLEENAQEASILPEIMAEDKITSDPTVVRIPEEPFTSDEVEEVPIIEEVTEQLIEEGKLPPRPIENEQNPNLEVIESDKSAEKQYLDELYRNAMRKDTVYYIAVVKYQTEDEIRNLVRKLSSKEYETFAVPESDGSNHLCLEKFSEKENANAYLSLVKKYDDRKAYLLEREE